MNKCEGCSKPCLDNLYNEDGECWQLPTIYQLAVLGGEQAAKLVEKQIDTVTPVKSENA